MDELFRQLAWEKLETNLVDDDKISKCYEIIKNLYSNLKIEIAFLRENKDEGNTNLFES